MNIKARTKSKDRRQGVVLDDATRSDPQSQYREPGFHIMHVGPCSSPHGVKDFVPSQSELAELGNRSTVLQI